MPNTCCRRAPSATGMRRASSAAHLAPPTWSIARLERSFDVLDAAWTQAAASGGTTAARVTRSASISAKHVSASGEGASTDVPPAWTTPSRPGELIVKLCAAGRAARYTVSGVRPQMSALARTL